MSFILRHSHHCALLGFTDLHAFLVHFLHADLFPAFKFYLHLNI